MVKIQLIIRGWRCREQMETTREKREETQGSMEGEGRQRFQNYQPRDSFLKGTKSPGSWRLSLRKEQPNYFNNRIKKVPVFNAVKYFY